MNFVATFLLPYLVPVIGPMVVALAKALVDRVGVRIPKVFYPTVASAISGVSAALVGLTIPGVPPAVSAAIVGLASVGVREVYDQVKNFTEKNP